MTTTKAIIYCRFSPRPDADESQSNKKQEERCRECAATRGYKVVDVQADEALTGMDDELDPDPVKATLNRPGLLAAINAIKPGMVLLVRWRNRIARDPFIQGWVRRKVMKKGGRIEAADESNEQGLAGELLENTLATVDKYNVIRIRLDTALAMQKYQRAGRRMGRLDRCPFGWKPDPRNLNRLVEDVDEQETIRLVMEQHKQGIGGSAICRYLDQLGRPRRGKSWRGGRGMVQAIIDRQTAAAISDHPSIGIA
jgi:DNA invertase Pin-like site-specific DNA recombinase